MRLRFRFVVLAVCAVAATTPAATMATLPTLVTLVTAPGASPADRPELDALLDRAAWYLDFFIDQFENVVAEESYIQDASTPLPAYTPLTGRGGTVLPGASPADLARARHRDLLSDFLLVKAPDTSA